MVQTPPRAVAVPNQSVLVDIVRVSLPPGVGPAGATKMLSVRSAFSEAKDLYPGRARRIGTPRLHERPRERRLQLHFAAGIGHG